MTGDAASLRSRSAAFRRTTIRRALLTCAWLLTTNCMPRERVFEGVYQRGFEGQQFFACSAERDDSPWWVVLNAEMQVTGDSLLAGLPMSMLHARFKGTVGKRGQFGHLGLSTRVLTVKEIITVRRQRDGDCWPNSDRAVMIRRTSAP